MVWPLWETVGQFLKRVNRVAIWPCDSTSRYTPKRNENVLTQKLTLFTAALFIKAKQWQQFKCLSAAEWKNRTWCIYTSGYYLAIKWSADPRDHMDEPWKYAKWKCQSRRTTWCMIPLIWTVRADPSSEEEEGGVGGGDSDCWWARGFLVGGWKCSKIGDGGSTALNTLKPLHCALEVNYMVCEWYLNKAVFKMSLQILKFPFLLPGKKWKGKLLCKYFCLSYVLGITRLDSAEKKPYIGV